jgi:hypothetical protein
MPKYHCKRRPGKSFVLRQIVWFHRSTRMLLLRGHYFYIVGPYRKPLVKDHDSRPHPGDHDLTDWQVVISENQEVLEVRQMSIDMSNTRMKPVYSPRRELTIIILAKSEEMAKRKAVYVAQRIADAGLWGLDLLNLRDPELFS